MAAMHIPYHPHPAHAARFHFPHPLQSQTPPPNPAPNAAATSQNNPNSNDHANPDFKPDKSKPNLPHPSAVPAPVTGVASTCTNHTNAAPSSKALEKALEKALAQPPPEPSPSGTALSSHPATASLKSEKQVQAHAAALESHKTTPEAASLDSPSAAEPSQEMELFSVAEFPEKELKPSEEGDDDDDDMLEGENLVGNAWSMPPRVFGGGGSSNHTRSFSSF